jgi:hypothetical protein
MKGIRMTIRPIPVDREESKQMARTSTWRGQKLCVICCQNVADTTCNGDDACGPCVRELTQSRGR